MSVLLAEDDLDIRDVLADMLRAEGFEVLEAGNGREALQLALTQRPNVIVTDLMMPMMDGRELISALKARAALSTVPIIVITAFRGYTDGLAADRMLAKPFDLDELTAAIHELAA